MIKTHGEEDDTSETSSDKKGTTPKRRLSDRHDIWSVAPYVLSFLFLITSLYAAVSVYKTSKNANRGSFEHKVDDINNRIAHSLDSYSNILKYTLAFTYASEKVEPYEWVEFVDALQFKDTLPDMAGIGFIDNIQEQNLQKYLSGMRKEVHKDFINKPTTNYPNKYIVKHIHPITNAGEALGLDIAFEKRRRDAAETARDTGMVTLTEHLALAQDHTGTQGFLLLYPSYKTRHTPDTVEQRRKQHNGWVYAPIASKSLFKNFADMSHKEINFTIYQGDRITPKNQIYKTNWPPVNTLNTSKYETITTIEHANTVWTLHWEPSAFFQHSSHESKAYIIAILGTFISIVLFFTIYHLIHLREIISQKVKLRTTQLKDASERYDAALEGSSVGLWDWNIKTGDLFWSDRFLEIAGMIGVETSPKFIDYIDRIHHKDHSLALAALSKHIEDREPYDIEYRLRQDNGEFVWIHAKGQAIWDENGKATRMAGSIQDITYKKQAEYDLKFKNNLLQMSEKTAKLGHWIYDIGNQSIFWSDTVYNIHGVDKASYTPEAKGFSDFYHVDDMEEVQNALKDCIKEHKSFEYRLRVIQQDSGKTIYVRNIGMPEIDKYGRVKSIFGILQDVTETSENEIALQQYKENTQILIHAIDACQVGITMSDASRKDHPLTFVNKAFEEITGYNRDEVIGKNTDFLNGDATDKDDIKQLHEAIKNRDSTSVNIINYKKNGEAFWNSHQMSPVYSEDNKVIAYVGIQTDITQLKEAQNALRQERDVTSHIIEYSPSLIVGLSADGVVQFANQASLNVSQVTSKDFVGQKWWHTLYRKNDPKVMELLQEFEEKKRLENFEIELASGDGEKHLISWTTINLYNEENDIDKIICIGTDLTKERENAKNEQEKQKLASLGTMAGGVAHEINNALTPIILLSEDLYMHMGDQDKETKANLEVIVDYAMHARNIVDDISLYSRQAEREQKDYSAKELIHNALSFAEKTLPHTTSIKHDIDNTIDDHMISVNKTGFIQVAHNLLNNASHAMEFDGEIHVKVRKETLASSTSKLPKGDYLKITVSDKGHGISKENLKLIFDPFFTTKAEGEGSGLGLSVVYGLIKKWGGDITAKSQKGKGAEFTIRLPLASKTPAQESKRRETA